MSPRPRYCWAPVEPDDPEDNDSGDEDEECLSAHESRAECWDYEDHFQRNDWDEAPDYDQEQLDEELLDYFRELQDATEGRQRYDREDLS